MNKNKIGIGIIIGIIFYLILPLGIDKVLMNKFYTNWSLGEWAGFLGSYLGSGIGGVITLFGVWWQIKKDDKNKKIGVLKGILYSLNKNLEDKRLEILMKQSFYVLNYQSENIVYYKFYNTFIYEIFDEIIKENYKIIFELDFGNKIIELNDIIKEYNQNHKFLALELKNKKNILDEIEEFISDHRYFFAVTKVDNFLKNIKDISNFFYSDLEKNTKEEILKKGKEFHENIDSLINVISKENALLEKSNKLQQYILSENILLNDETNIFKIMKLMEELKNKIEVEIKSK